MKAERAELPQQVPFNLEPSGIIHIVEDDPNNMSLIAQWVKVYAPQCTIIEYGHIAGFEKSLESGKVGHNECCDLVLMDIDFTKLRGVNPYVTPTGGIDIVTNKMKGLNNRIAYVSSSDIQIPEEITQDSGNMYMGKTSKGSSLEKNMGLIIEAYISGANFNLLGIEG